MAVVLALAAAVLYGSADFLGGVGSRRASAPSFLTASAPVSAVIMLVVARSVVGAALLSARFRWSCPPSPVAPPTPRPSASSAGHCGGRRRADRQVPRPRAGAERRGHPTAAAGPAARLVDVQPQLGGQRGARVPLGPRGAASLRPGQRGHRIIQRCGASPLPMPPGRARTWPPPPTGRRSPRTGRPGDHRSGRRRRLRPGAYLLTAALSPVG